MVSYIYSLLNYSLPGLNKPWLTVYWPASANNHMIDGCCYQQNYITYVSFSEQRKHEVTEEEESLRLQNQMKGGWIDKSFIQFSGIKYSSLCSLFDWRNLTGQVSRPAWGDPHTFIFFHFLDVFKRNVLFQSAVKRKINGQNWPLLTSQVRPRSVCVGGAQWERDRQEGAAVSAEKVTL